MNLQDAIKRKIRVRTIQELNKRLPGIVSGFVEDLQKNDKSVVLDLFNSGLEVNLKNMLIKCLNVAVKVVKNQGKKY
jgi:cobyric acid synthase